MLQIKNGRVMNPATGLDEVTDLWIQDGKILAYGEREEFGQPEEVIEIGRAHV